MTDLITTDLSPVPSRSAPSTFSSRMDTWLGKISTWTTEANALAVGANTNKLAAEAAQTAAETAETNAETAETNAAASETAAANSAQTALNAPGTAATSTTSLTVGTGSKTLTIQTDKDIVVGMFVMIARTSAPSSYMLGQVTAYNSGTGSLTVFVDTIGGSGTHTDWTISLSTVSKIPIASKFADLDVSSYTYAAGELTSGTYSSGNKIELTYDASNRLSTTEYLDTDGTTVLATETYTYDVDGNIDTSTWS